MPELIKAIIIDDEPIACDNLQRILRSFVTQKINICGIASNTTEGQILIEKHQPDLIFLDIEMPDESGLSFLERIAPFNFEVIFTTAYDAFALKAFRLNALDYILKPIDIDELENALGKVAEKMAFKGFIHSRIAAKEPGTRHLLKEGNKVLLRNGNNVEIVEIAQILYIAANGSYATIFFLKDGKVRNITMSHSIAKYEQQMSQHEFYRIHKSYLVNMTYIERIIKDKSPALLLKYNIQLPVGRRRYAGLLSFLGIKQHEL